MASTLTYYRFRKEVPGIYVVKLHLELQPNEKAEVNVGRYRDRGYDCQQYYGGSCGSQLITRKYPKNPLEIESLQVHEYNEIGNFWLNDTITIEVKDTRLEKWGGGPHQITVITATMDDIKVENSPCTLHNRTWSPITFTDIVIHYGGEYIPTPTPISTPAVSTQQPFVTTPFVPPQDIDLREHFAAIQTYRAEYPNLAQAQIVQLISHWTDGNGVLNKKGLLKSLNKSNNKAKIRAEGESLAMREAESIIESKM